MTVQEQLDAWVRGESIHNPTRNECTPDFSCCRPDLAAPAPVRRLYLDASKEVQLRMLGYFMGRLLEHSGCEVRS